MHHKFTHNLCEIWVGKKEKTVQYFYHYSHYPRIIEDPGLVEKLFVYIFLIFFPWNIVKSCLLENKSYGKIEHKVIAHLCTVGIYFLWRKENNYFQLKWKEKRKIYKRPKKDKIYTLKKCHASYKTAHPSIIWFGHELDMWCLLFFRRLDVQDTNAS